MNRAERLIELIQKVTDRPKMGLEVGSRGGFTSEKLLDVFPELFLYLIDPYEAYQDHKHFYDNKAQVDYKRKCLDRLKPFPNRFKLIENYSYKVSKRIPDDLDFIFIDGEHTTYAVMIDLFLYAPKVRPGGLVCGHDWQIPKVKEGVIEYMRARDIDFQTIGFFWYFKK